MPAKHNPIYHSSPSHHILTQTTCRSFLPHQRLDQHFEPHRPGQLFENQAEAFYPIRSQASILNHRGPIARSEMTYIARTPAQNLSDHVGLQKSSLNLSRDLLLNHRPWQPEDQRGNKNQGRNHSIKTNL